MYAKPHLKIGKISEAFLDGLFNNATRYTEDWSMNWKKESGKRR